MSTMSKTGNINIRVSAEERAEIDRRATEAGMTLTAYLVAAALGRREDPPDPPPLHRMEAALERIEAALARIEDPSEAWR